MSSPPTSVSSVSASTSTPSAARSGVGIERRRSADKPASTSTPSAARSGVGTERRRSAAKEAGPSLVLPDPARLASTPSISTDRSASSRFRKTPSRSSSPTKQPASRSASPVKKSSAFPPSIFATSSDTPVWVYNERQGFIYKDVRYAMRDMQDEDRRLKVVRSGVEMQEVLSAGAVLRQGVKEEEDFEAIEIEQIEDSDVEMH